MNVLLVTSWGDQICGISEHSKMLIEAVHACAPDIHVTPEPRALDPDWHEGHGWDVLHLNYQASLHSRWTPDKILRERRDHKVLVTFHDTGVPNSEQCKRVIAACDAAVVHEPFDDLPAEKTHYWRQGVPVHDFRTGYPPFKGYPTIGTVGFDFPWKNYDLLCDLAGELGWAARLFLPTEPSAERVRDLKRRARGRLDFHVGDQTRDIVAGLSECDATAFLYVTHNTGTSGAIRLGIAAKKPLIAFRTCRQFRDLVEVEAVYWADTVDEVKALMRYMVLGRFDTGIAALAEQDSWTRLGQKYADLYRSLVA